MMIDQADLEIVISLFVADLEKAKLESRYHADVKLDEAKSQFNFGKQIALSEVVAKLRKLISDLDEVRMEVKRKKV